MKIVIRAGGVGSRLWPVSRLNKPKQLHPLLSNKTMLQEAIERALSVVKPEDIYVSGNVRFEEEIRNELGAVVENNLIIEPDRRETAAAIGLEAVYIAQKDPKAIVASLGSDHAIAKNKEFARILRLAENIIKKHPQDILCIGIKPTQADTGYGYIELDKKISSEAYSVKSFKEKPNKKKAEEFLNKGNYLWNANMFVWRVDTLLDLYKKYLPGMHKKLMLIQKAIGTDQEKDVLHRIYPRLDKIAVDYAIIEKAKKIIALSADIGWNDIGDWARLKDQLAKREEENVIKTKEYFGLDNKNSLIYSEKNKLIATVGLENIIIVETDDALLVCDKYRSADVKKIQELLKKRKKNRFL